MCDKKDVSEQYYRERGFSRAVGRGHAGILSLLTYYWVNPLLQKGAACDIQENTAEAFVDPQNRARFQAEEFSTAYQRAKVDLSPCGIYSSHAWLGPCQVGCMPTGHVPSAKARTQPRLRHS